MPDIIFDIFLSVTQRAGSFKQPRGGLLPLKSFERALYDDGKQLHETETVAPGFVGVTVDYLTRIACGAEPEDAFAVALAGAEKLERASGKSAVKMCRTIVEGMDDPLDELNVAAACRIVGCFDAFYRCGRFTQPANVKVDRPTIENIRTMVSRAKAFIDAHGPVLLSGFTLEGGYTETVNSGDGDFLLAGGLFDLKTTKRNPAAKDTLQLLMYYLMGQRSIHPEFQRVDTIGFFNPRQNVAFTKKVTDIPQETIEIVSTQVIGY